jgi:hypothetical protein
MSKYSPLAVDLESQIASDAHLANIESRLATLEAAVIYNLLPRCKRLCFAVCDSYTNTLPDDPTQFEDRRCPFWLEVVTTWSLCILVACWLCWGMPFICQGSHDMEQN